MDIRDANKNIRDAYRTYFRLKTTALMNVINIDDLTENNSEISESTVNTSESTLDNKPDDEVQIDEQIWGTHLNKQLPKEEKENERKVTENVTSMYSKKLFDNSKFTKRNPRSRLSLNKSKSLDNIEKKKSVAETFSQPTKSLNENDFKQSDNLNYTLPVKCDSAKTVSQSINVIDQMINNSFSRPIRTVDRGWLQRVSFGTGISNIDKHVKEITENSVVMNEAVQNIVSPVENDIEENVANVSTDLDIISGSDEDEMVTYHVAKRRKLSNNDMSISLSGSSLQIFEKNELLQNVTTTKENENNALTILEKSEIHENILKVDTVGTDGTKIDDNSDDSDYKPSPKKGKNKKIADKNVTNKRKRPQRQTRGKKIETNSELNEATAEEYVMEYSIKPPPKTVPRIKNLPKIKTNLATDDPNSQGKTIKPSTKKEIAEEKLKKKIASGTLNDNFVRIDIQKKVYTRGKKHMNFSKYKKRLWKDKKKALYGPDMDMGGCDGGLLTCFKCGKTGHMARKCQAPVDKLMPLETYEEELAKCPIPSLEQASDMARNSALAVHKPNIDLNSDKEPMIEETSTEDAEREENNDEYDFEENDELDDFIANTDIENLPSMQVAQSWEFIDEQKIVKPLYDVESDGSLKGICFLSNFVNDL